MIYRRTRLGWLSWAAYTVLCAGLLVCGGGIFLTYMTQNAALPVRLLGGVCALAFAALLYWGLRSVWIAIRKKRTWRARTVRVLGGVAFLALLAGGMAVRIAMLRGLALLTETQQMAAAGDLQYYNMTMVTAGEAAVPPGHSIEFLYVLLLETVLSFLGNKILSAAFTQVVLQVLGMLLAYAAVSRLAGRFPACLTLLCLSCAPVSLRTVMSFNPAWLFLDCYLAGMLLMASFVKGYCEGRIGRIPAVFGGILLGLLTGALAWLDLTALSLLPVALLAAYGRKERRAAEKKRLTGGFDAAVVLLVVVCCAAAWCGILCAVSYSGGTPYDAVFAERLLDCWHRSYPYVWHAMDSYPGMAENGLAGLLIVFASFLVFAYCRSGREQNFTLWIWLCLLTAPTPMAAYGVSGGLLPLFVWAALAGLGLQNCMFGDRARVMQAILEQINTEAEAAMAAEPTAETTGGTVTEIAAETTEKMKEPITPETTEKTKVPTTPETEAGMTAATQEKTTANYIENPLPLPKKHVKRELDYQYEVPEEKMKYDVEVADGDDYDIP